MADPTQDGSIRASRWFTRLLIAMCLATLVWSVVRFAPAPASSLDAARVECAACGLAADEVAKWIEDARRSGLDRSGLVKLYASALSDPVDGGACRACVDAVLTAAGR